MRAHLKQHAILFYCPRIFANIMVEMIVPAFATLLSRPPSQLLRHECPATGAVHSYQMPDQCILLLTPLLACRAGAGAHKNIRHVRSVHIFVAGHL